MKISFLVASLLTLSISALVHADSVQGWLDEANCEHIAGWSARQENPDSESVNVSIFADSSTVEVASTTANWFRQDLKDAGNIGNGNHAFYILTPQQLLDSKAHVVTATGDGTLLAQHQSPLTVKCSSPSFTEGYLDEVDCNHIAGWEWDSNYPNRPLSMYLQIYDSQNRFRMSQALAANQFRPDLLNAQKGNGYHSFSMIYPDDLLNGETYTIHAFDSASGHELSYSPKTIYCDVPKIEGFLDVADCNAISGWAWNPARPNDPIPVNILIDGKGTDGAAASMFRADLLAAGKGNGYHGFSRPANLTPKQGFDYGIPHTVSVTVDSQTLISPKTVICYQ